MRIKKVKYLEDYKLKLLFDDKKTKIVDIEPIIKKSKGLFHPLKNLDYFKKVSLDDDQYPLSICWPNGEDLCPSVLYEIGQEVPIENTQMNSQLKRRTQRKTLQYYANAYKVKKQKKS